MDRLLFSSAHALWIVALATIGLTGTAQAAYYGTYSSPTGDVTFVDVEDLNGLYGAPIASGNSLDFSPNTFEADCTNDPGCPPASTVTSDTITFQVDADNGSVIEGLRFSESGDIVINDFTIPTGFAAVTVAANVFVDILEVNGTSISGINVNVPMVFTQGGAYETNDEGNGAHIWSGLLDLDLDAIIAGAGQTGSATLVDVSISNTLTAYGENGAVAFIEKKDVDGLAVTVIPEPGTALLMALGLAGLATAGRRPRSA